MYNFQPFDVRSVHFYYNPYHFIIIIIFMYMFTAAISILVFRAASLTKVLTCERLSAFASITPLCCPWLFTCPPAIYASSWLAGCATSTAQYVCLLHYNIVITFNAPTRTHTDIHANCFHSFALFAFFFRIFVLFFVTSICFVFFFFFLPRLLPSPTFCLHIRCCVIHVSAGLQLLACQFACLKLIYL